jgi:hypothetical protein
MISLTIPIFLALGIFHCTQAQGQGIVDFYTAQECNPDSVLGDQLSVPGGCFNFADIGGPPQSIQATGSSGELILCTSDNCEGASDGTSCQTFEIPTGCLDLLNMQQTMGSAMLA